MEELIEMEKERMLFFLLFSFFLFPFCFFRFFFLNRPIERKSDRIFSLILADISDCIRLKIIRLYDVKKRVGIAR